MPSLSRIIIFGIVWLVAWSSGAFAAWEDVSTPTGSRAVPGRGQHGFTVTPDGTLYVFGGAREVRGAKSTRFELLNDFWRQAPGDTFSDITTASACPIPPTIEPHLASDSQGRIYEFGGVQGDVRGWFSNRLYRFDPRTMSWSDLTPADSGLAPLGREDHGFVADWKRDRLWVFGGVTQRDSLVNDLWFYDVHAERWTQVATTSAPAARELYDLVWDGRDALYLFGGWTAASGYLNDFWRYDIDRAQWVDLTAATHSAAISPRSYAGLTADPNGILWLAGGYASPLARDGFWRFDPRVGVWKPVASSGAEEFLPRATYELVYRPSDCSLYIFGGLLTPSVLSQQYRSDVWRYPLRPSVADASDGLTAIHAASTIVLSTRAQAASGRALTYRWSVDGRLLAQSTASVEIGPLCPGPHDVHVVVRDGALADTMRWTFDLHGDGAPREHVQRLTADVCTADVTVRWSLGGDGRADAFRVLVFDGAWRPAADVPATARIAGPDGECAYEAVLHDLAPDRDYTIRVVARAGETSTHEAAVSVHTPRRATGMTVSPRGRAAAGAWRFAVHGARASELRAVVSDVTGRAIAEHTRRIAGGDDATIELPAPRAAGVYSLAWWCGAERGSTTVVALR